MLFSAGLSDVFGAFVNQSGGKTIISGAGNVTFYDDVTNDAGSELRVSTGSVVTIFGTLSGLSQITGAGTVNIEGPASSGAIVRSGATYVGPVGSLAADAIRNDRLILEGNASIAMNGSSSGTSRMRVLTILPGARMDLANNDLVIDHTGVDSPIATIRGYLLTGRNGGAGNGNGLASSTAASVASTALGYAESNDVFGAGGGTFSGQAVDGTTLLVKYTYYGDTDLDGIVNFDDYSRIDGGFNSGGTGWFTGDFDYNGQINFDDYSLIDLAFNTQSGTLIRAMDYLEGEDRSLRGMDDPALQKVVDHFAQFGNGYATAFLSSVPEPTSLSCVVFALVALRRRRRGSTIGLRRVRQPVIASALHS